MICIENGQIHTTTQGKFFEMAIIPQRNDPMSSYQALALVSYGGATTFNSDNHFYCFPFSAIIVGCCT